MQRPKQERIFQSICAYLMLALFVDSSIARPNPPEDSGLGLPSLVIPADNPQSEAKIALGEKLFFDARLSRERSVSCATCHKAEHAFSDRRALAQGTNHREGTRNTPSLFNAAFNSTQFWDGRRNSLESQVLDPLLNPIEHGLSNYADVVDVINRDPVYIEAFMDAFGIGDQNIRISHVAHALASYIRTLIAGNSPFDRYKFRGEKRALSLSAQRGLALFEGAARCVSCHTIGDTSALFTDNAFHSVNVGLQRIAPKLPYLTKRWLRSAQNGTGADHDISLDRDIAELGRFLVTHDPADIAKFRTPSLRNVALTAPYMHDGSVASLEQAIDLELYNRGAERGRPLVLTIQERRDLAEFLRSLTSAAAIEPREPMGRHGR